MLSRLVFNKVGAATHWTVVVENRAGAGGNIGLDTVAKARADGYTVGMGQTANLAINPSLYPKMPYDAVRDFTPVVLVSAQPVVVIVRQDAPFKTLADLVAAGKAKQLSMASAGTGTVGHLTGEMFQRRAGIKAPARAVQGRLPGTDRPDGRPDRLLLRHAAHRPADAQGRQATRAGRNLRQAPAAATQRAHRGRTGLRRLPGRGLEGARGARRHAGRGGAAPQRRGEQGAEGPDTVAKLREEGSEPRGGSPADLATVIKAENTRWGTIVRESGAKAE